MRGTGTTTCRRSSTVIAGATGTRGTLLDGARSAIAERLDALDAALEQAAEAGSGDV